MLEQCKEWPWCRFITNRGLLVVVLFSLVSQTLPMNASPVTSEQTDSQLPAGKQTSLGLYVTSKEAYEKWQAAPDKVTILDVRTPEEFLFIGHADMAWNIPVASQSYQWDVKNKQLPMSLLADFVSRVQTVAGPGDVLLVTCRSGGRSAMAVNLLARAGFKNVYNITDGVEGDTVKDPNSIFEGQRLVNGWKNSGLPWTYNIEPDRVVLPTEEIEG